MRLDCNHELAFCLCEMDQKLQEHFSTGVQLVWYGLPDRQEVHIYTAPDQREILTAEDNLHGAEVLPGLHLPIRRLFDDAET